MTTLLSSNRKVLIGATGGSALAGTALLAVLLGSWAPVVCLMVVAAGLVGMLRVGQKGSVPGWVPRVGFVGGLVAMAGVTVLDGSWVSGLAVGLCLAVVVVAWRALGRQLRPATPLSANVRAALSTNGVTLMEESAGGWHLGVTPGGGVVMIREVAFEEGPVEGWRGVAKAAESMSVTQQVVAAQGLTATAVLFTPDGTIGPVTVGDLTVVSTTRAGLVLRSVATSTVSPEVLAAHGINPNRAAARQVAKKTGGPAKGRIVHQGRVTKKA